MYHIHRLKLFIVLIFIKLCECNESIDIKINQGILSGLVEKTFLKGNKYFAFRGIPFAEPPLGTLRFRPPVPHKHWDGTYEAHKNKPTCFQFSYRRRNNEPHGFSGSEDCLYLSVYTPSLEETAPVVVFDYNDNFKTGFNGSDTYSPDFFIEEGVVVVTINHRLGILGYFTTEDDVIPPNAGLKDFILGLNWINDNIKAFGGDPSQVTIMGNRGGAALANMMLYSEAAKNLFSAVIMQSGSAMESIYFYKNSRGKAFELGEVFNMTTDDSNVLLEKLQTIDVEVLFTEEGKVNDNNQVDDFQSSAQLFSPIIEKPSPDAVLTRSPVTDNIINDVPVLIGFNSREGLDLVSHYIIEPRLIDASADFLFVFPIKVNYRFNANSTAFKNAIEKVKYFYMEDGNLHYSNILDYAVYVGDMLQNYALHVTARKLSKELQSNLYYYMFDYRGLLNENSEQITKYLRFSMQHWGATITDELCYLHLCSRIKSTYDEFKELPSEQPEFKVLKKMVKMWTNFVKTRDPTPRDDKDLKHLKWLPVDSAKNNYLHIGKKFKMQENPLGERAKFWDDFLKEYQEMAQNGVVGSEELEHDEL
ncbi:esterase B1-like [Zerene cesonia]|uniref:esterase B1-like n=1 Tax=Zerene cesonia TaxID=33412 RepID=UPI0018E4E2DC|nr:esterase B1-like [Zerene cesonia]